MYLILSLSDLTPGGLYGSPIKLAVLIIVPIFWLLMAGRLNADADAVAPNRALWAGLYLGAGALGLLIWLVTPMFIIGVLVFVVLVLSILISYSIYRDGLVDDALKIGPLGLFGVSAGARTGGGVTADVKIRFYDADGRPVMLTEQELSEAALVRKFNATQTLLFDVAYSRASEAEFVPVNREQVHEALVVDGVVMKKPPVSLKEYLQAVTYILEKANIDPQKLDAPQRGKISLDVSDKPTDVILIVEPTQLGPKLRLRIMSEMVRTEIEDLGMDEPLLKAVKGILATKGLFLCAAPPKCGLTSMLYSLLKSHDAYMTLLASVEMNPPRELENITQNTYAKPAELAETLAAALRRDPDVIMVDQCPDAKTAEILIKAAEEKTIILGVPASDALNALAAWVRTVGKTEPAVRNLKGVLAGRLIRKLCPTCRQPYRPDANLLKKLRLPEKPYTFFQPPSQPLVDDKGNPLPCNTCHDIHFFGRTGIFELLAMNDDLRKAINQGAGIDQLRAITRQMKMRTLQQHATFKVVGGETALAEMIRVLK